MKEFFKGIELDELLMMAASIYLGRKGGKGEAGSPSTPSGKASIGAQLVERLVDKVGIGKSETEFGLKLNKLLAADPASFLTIQKFIDGAEQKQVEHLMVVTVNVPSPSPKVEKIKGKRERKNKDGEVLEEAVPDKVIETPSEFDGGVEFLKIVAKMIDGKDITAQVEVLRKMHWLPRENNFLKMESLAEAARDPERSLD